MIEYFLHTRKKTTSNFHGLYLKENGKLCRLRLEEKTENYKIIQHLKKSKRSEIEIKQGENLLDAIYKRDVIYRGYKNLKKYDKELKIKNEPGIYYPRIFRPLFPFTNTVVLQSEKVEKRIQSESGNYELYQPRNEEIMISSINQLTILTDELNTIFKTIQPNKDNHKAYGHNIRNLLILACTEVEAQFKGVLVLNESNTKTRYTTNDFIKLKKILKLDDYKVGFNYYPSISPIYPFKNWKEESPTKSLKWYDNYNAVKHDREGSFHKATLKDAISAISAVAILIVAQYGERISYWNERIGKYYNFNSIPNWTILEYILPPLENNEWKESKFNI